MLGKRGTRFSEPVAVDPVGITAVKNLIRTTPIVKAAISDLIEEIFIPELEFFRGEKPVVPDTELKNHVKNMIMPCVKENILSIFITGLAFFTMHNENGSRVVRSPLCELEIQTYYDHLEDRRKFVVKRKHLQETQFFENCHGSSNNKKVIDKSPPKKKARKNKKEQSSETIGSKKVNDTTKYTLDNVHVLSGFGYDPDENGALNSPAYSIVGEVTFLEKLQRAYTRTLEKNSEATIVTEVPPGTNGMVDDKFSMGLYAESGYQGREEMQYARTKQQTYHLFSLYETLRNEAGPRTYTDINKKTTKEDFYSSICPLPPGHKYVSKESSPSPSDFVKLKEMSQEITAAVFGSTRSSILGIDPKTTAGVQAVNAYRARTLAHLRKTASNLMTHYYRLTTWEEECDALSSELHHHVKNGGDIDMLDISKLASLGALTIVIPTESTLNLDALAFCAEQKAISREEFVNGIRRIIGLPSLEKNDPLLKEISEQGTKSSADNKRDKL